MLCFEEKITVALFGVEGREGRVAGEGNHLCSAQRQPDRAGARLADEVDAEEAVAAVRYPGGLGLWARVLPSAVGAGRQEGG
jgi:hypothetical protein